MAYSSKYTGAEVEARLDSISDIPNAINRLLESKGYVTKGDILCVIKDLIGDIEGGGGGHYLIGLNDSTSPTEDNAYSAIRANHRFLTKEEEDETLYLIKFLGGIITTFAKSEDYAEDIEGWGIIKDTTGEWKIETSKFVSRTLATVKDLIVKNHATFIKSLSSEEFISGFPTGKGWAIRMKEYINSSGTKELRSVGEFDDLIVRGTLRVFEFVINQLLGENDNRIFTSMMEVEYYDSETGVLYMNTKEGVLYNPFRKGDIILVQQYNGLPSEENDYYVTKQYEFVVTDVGIGNLEDKENRLDWLTFTNFTSPMENASLDLIKKKDTLVRIDNLYDPKRKGIVQINSIGEDTPHMDFIYGRKTDPDNYLKGRLGNLGGIYNELFGWLREYGAFLANLYAIGEFKIAHTGEDVADAIEMLKGSFKTNFSQTTYDINEETDFFTNASFTNNCENWILTEENTSFFSVGEGIQFFNYEPLVSEESFAGLAEYDGRNALRLNIASAKQLNNLIKKPSTHTEYNNIDAALNLVGSEVIDTLYLSLRVYCNRPGIIEFGFTDSNNNYIQNSFYKNESLEASNDAYTFKLSGKWDGLGDFTIKSTGDVYIDLLSFTDKPLENYRITTSTAIEQDSKAIKLLGTRIDGINGTITTVQQTVNAQAGTISSIASRVSSTETSISNLTVSVNGINSTVSSKVGKNEIISSINQTSENVTINANKINLNGVITANKTFKIDTTGYMTCIGGTIGGFTIKENYLSATSGVNMVIDAGAKSIYPSISWSGTASSAYAALGVATTEGYLGGQLFLSNTNNESTVFTPQGLSMNGSNHNILFSTSVVNTGTSTPYPAITVSSKRYLNALICIGFKGSKISFYSTNWPTSSADVGVGEVYLDGNTLKVRKS